MEQLFKPSPRNETNTIVATTTTQSRALPGSGLTAVFYNDGGSLVFVRTGKSSVISDVPSLSTNAGTVGATPIPIGQAIPLRIDPEDTHWAVIGLGAANVYCTRGEGV